MNIIKHTTIHARVPNTPMLEEVGFVKIELTDSLSDRLKMLLNTILILIFL